MRVSLAILAATAAFTATLAAPAGATRTNSCDVSVHHHSVHTVYEDAGYGVLVKPRRANINTYLTLNGCRVVRAALVITPRGRNFDCTLMKWATFTVQGVRSHRAHCVKGVGAMIAAEYYGTTLPKADGTVTARIHLTNKGVWPDQHWGHTYQLAAS
jgi:hypothetical protein